MLASLQNMLLVAAEEPFDEVRFRFGVLLRKEKRHDPEARFIKPKQAIGYTQKMVGWLQPNNVAK